MCALWKRLSMSQGVTYARNIHVYKMAELTTRPGTKVQSRSVRQGMVMCQRASNAIFKTVGDACLVYEHGLFTSTVHWKRTFSSCRIRSMDIIVKRGEGVAFLLLGVARVGRLCYPAPPRRRKPYPHPLISP